MDNLYDILIIGGGPAGLTAGLYASRARMKALLMEMGVCGGQAMITDTIENFPAFPDGVKGHELAGWMTEQAKRFGLAIETAEVKSVGRTAGLGGAFTVGLSGGAKIEALSVVVASGAKWKALGIPGEGELSGRGVSYCATCDGPLFRGKDVVVVGGGDTAIEDALFLSKFARKVTVVHRRDRLRAAKILQERAFAEKKIEFSLNSVAVAIEGKERVSGIRIKDVKTGKEALLECGGVFVLIGLLPNSGVVRDLVKCDESGYIICDDDMKTSIDGIFACGDVRKKLLRQVVTATGDGATAAVSAGHYVDRLRGTEYK